MLNSTLLENLRMVDAKDFDELQRFTASEFHNRSSFRDEVRGLLEFLVGHYPNYSEEVLNKDQVFEHLFPGKPFVAGKIEKVMTELNKVIRDFILWRQYNAEENEFYRSMDWIRQLRIRGDEHRHELAMRRIRKEHDAEPKVSTEYYYQKYLIEREEHEWQSAVNRVRDDVNLVEVMYSLVDYTSLQFQEFISATLMQKWINNIEIPEFLIRYSNYEIESRTENHREIFYTFKNINELLSNTEQIKYEDFDAFFQFIKKSEHKFNTRIVKEFYLYLRNLCTILIDLRHQFLRPLLHEIQKDNLSKGYFNFGDKISHGAYSSITNIALTTGNYDWAYRFIEDYKDKILGDSESMEFYRINLAYYYFELSDYEKSLDLIAVYPKIITYTLICKRLEIKCYYELNSDLLSYKLDAFKMYLIRTSSKFISPQQQKINLLFLRLVSQLKFSKLSKNKLFDIKEKINTKEYIAENLWLNKKIDEITGKIK